MVKVTILKSFLNLVITFERNEVKTPNQRHYMTKVNVIALFLKGKAYFE